TPASSTCEGRSLCRGSAVRKVGRLGGAIRRKGHLQQRCSLLGRRGAVAPGSSRRGRTSPDACIRSFAAWNPAAARGRRFPVQVAVFLDLLPSPFACAHSAAREG